MSDVGPEAARVAPARIETVGRIEHLHLSSP